MSMKNPHVNRAFAVLPLQWWRIFAFPFILRPKGTVIQRLLVKKLVVIIDVTISPNCAWDLSVRTRGADSTKFACQACLLTYQVWQTRKTLLELLEV